MIVRKLADTPILDNAHGVDARKIYDTEHAVLTVLTLEPGQSLKKHKTPVDVAFLVLEGTGIVEIGDERQEIGAGTLVESPKDIPHCWHNRSESVFEVLVVKAPRPVRKTVFVAG